MRKLGNRLRTWNDAYPLARGDAHRQAMLANERYGSSSSSQPARFAGARPSARMLGVQSVGFA